ncbi:Fe-S-containing hydro-lyase [Anaerotalea alkaliphila]|uniref:Fe-S-containing hydro-lyase n=1 Tax=Anaerotalea alkaliphila TaxID=2662126 RepID=A0A7X5HWT7_9FIRM|nr:Fe-S-containing hydro-lyase [Anaerotalea alkaliphila]NDL68098.1 Fe-S-containing hydro-lyase [Anaerotalea alkaliphila]
MVYNLETPLTEEAVGMLKAGDKVLLTGVVYTGRDAAHKKMVEQLERGESLPFDLHGNILYYVGPTPAKPGQVIGSAGPTTSYRMDAYAPVLMDRGLKGMIGKGDRNRAVVESMIKNQVVYFGAVGGAAALIASAIEEAEVIAYEELGTEAVRKLKVRNFPVTVVIDAQGGNLYETEKAKYRNVE